MFEFLCESLGIGRQDSCLSLREGLKSCPVWLLEGTLHSECTPELSFNAKNFSVRIIGFYIVRFKPQSFH